MKKLILCFSALCLLLNHAYAENIEVNGICYSIVENNNDAAVIGKWSDRDFTRPDINPSNEYTGNITIPSSFIYNGKTYTVRAIGRKAFSTASGVTSVKLPNTIASIGEYAFSNEGGVGGIKFAPKIKSITIPANVKTIDSYAFYNCDSLRNIELPDQLKSIGNYIFYRCRHLKEVQLPSQLENIGSAAFKSSALEQIYIPNTVKTIGAEAFASEAIREIKVAPNNAAFSDEDGVLFDRSKATLLYYPCAKILKHYEIPGSVSTIGEWAFSSVKELVSLTIPGSVTKVGNYPFSGKTLQYIYCKAQNPPACTQLFSNSTNVKIKLYVPRHSKHIYEATNEWNRFIINENLTKAMIEMQRNSASFSIEKETDAASYLIGLYADKELTQMIKLVNLDANGNTSSFRSENNTIEYTFNNLQPDHAYYYQITVLNSSSEPIAEQQGYLYYESSTDMDNNSADVQRISYCVEGNNLTFYQLPDRRINIFNIDGRLVKSIQADSESSATVTLSNGMYIIRIGNGTIKVIIK